MPSSLLLLKSPTSNSTPSPSSALETTHLTLLATSFNSSSLAHLSQLLCTPGNGEEASNFDGIVFCSQRAVKAFESILNESTSISNLKGIPHFVVGQQTRQSLLDLYGNKEQTPEVLGAESGTGEQLARVIIDHLIRPSATSCGSKNDGRRKRVLFLSGDKGTEILPRVLKEEAGDEIELLKIQVYATEVVQGFEQEFLNHLTKEREMIGETEVNRNGKEEAGRSVWIGVCSPSGGKQVVNILRAHSLLPPQSAALVELMANGEDREGEKEKNLRRRLKFVAIGNTTKDYLENEEGVKVDATATTPGEHGMVNAVLEAEALMRQV
ncbi:hypothetical protein JCM3765_006592 [Sporobolomyces pararoseus]